jgi:hypothetical protein
MGCPARVRLASGSDRIADIPDRQLCSKGGLMHRYQLGSRPAKPRQDRAAHDPILVAFGKERQFLCELRHALPVGSPRE